MMSSQECILGPIFSFITVDDIKLKSPVNDSVEFANDMASGLPAREDRDKSIIELHSALKCSKNN